MGEIRVVLIFNEDNERQKEIGRYLKSQKRCKTALITELVYAWLHKENIPVSSYNNANVSVEELKQQLLQDTDFIQQIKKSVVIEEDAGEVMEERQSDGLDMDEGMLMAGLSIFENLPCFHASINEYYTAKNGLGTIAPRLLSQVKVGTHSPFGERSHTRAHTPKQGCFGRGWYHYPRTVSHVSETLRGRVSERQTLPLLGLGQRRS